MLWESCNYDKEAIFRVYIYLNKEGFLAADKQFVLSNLERIPCVINKFLR